MKRVWLVLLLGIVAGMTACGGGSAGNGSTAPVTVTIAPVAATLAAGASQPFAAAVSGASNTTVTWSVLEGAAGGSVSSAGLYSAPQAAGMYHVVASSQADPRKTATAVVTVTPPVPPSNIFVTVSPISISRFAGESGTFVFTATVTGTENAAVTWSVVDGPIGGSITPAGAYTAAQTPGTYYVQATSVADPSKYALAQVTINPVPDASVSISPATAGVHPNGVQSFNGMVTNASYTGVNWRVQEGVAGGTIVSTDVMGNTADYTAPAVPGTYHVIATYALDSSKFAIATVVVTASGFTATGNMAADHGGHTAILLKDGRVLVACGFGSNGMAAAEAELFDPSAGTFTGFAATAREDCAATLLPDGKVLVAGGWSGDSDVPNVTATAELFDPSAGSFTSSSSLLTARYGHTATLLPNGEVLFAGGSTDYDSAFAGAELYDPASGGFTSTGSMLSSRYYHTATLLSNGKVLIVGGLGTPYSYPPAELYDPATGTFTATGPMVRARYLHTASLLPSGKVLIAGGLSDGYLAETEIYDPETNTFSVAASMMSARAWHTATPLPNGTVLVAGGANSVEKMSTAEIYDPVADTFTPTTSMSQPRWLHSAVRLADGSVLITGGYDSMNTAEIYK